jgi:hypothetical protein
MRVPEVIKDPNPRTPALIIPSFRLVEPTARREGWSVSSTPNGMMEWWNIGIVGIKNG